MPINLERMFENALDWEHLPFVHASSFYSIECLESGAWGWRARIENDRGHPSTIELRLDKALRRWITRTLEGRNRGSEIWTHAFPIGSERVDIVVDFFVPGVTAAEREKTGRAFAGLYERLYDEDVAMMVERQHQLDRRMGRSKADAKELDLGLRSTLGLPVRCEVGGRAYVVAELEGELVVYPALCPHQLGPLADGKIIDGSVRCPWHGYTFDLISGDCLNAGTCGLGERPEINEKDGRVVLTATH